MASDMISLAQKPQALRFSLTDPAIVRMACSIAARILDAQIYFDLAASFLACFSFGVSFGLLDFPFRFCSLFAMVRPFFRAAKLRQPDWLAACNESLSSRR